MKKLVKKKDKAFQKAMDELSKQQENVVRPLILQVKDREAQNQELLKEVRDLKKNLKMMHAVIRTPKLVDLFHKTERKRMTEKDIVKADQTAHLNLRKYKIDETNYEYFIDQLSSSVNH